MLPNRLFFILFFSVFAFCDTNTQGYLRLGFENHRDAKSVSDIAMGGKLKIISSDFHGISVATAFYNSSALTKAYNKGVVFYSFENKNVTLLGEAYINWVYKNTQIKIGRQVIDTPFADSDDIGMIPNLFEAATFINNSFDDTLLFFSYITKMAGVDAPVMDRFTNIADKNAIKIAGCIYEGMKNLSFEGWYYDVSDQENIFYFQSMYKQNYRHADMTFGLQYAKQNFNENKRADILGVMTQIIHAESGITLSGAYNKTISKNEAIAENFFGGGPFFSSAEHLSPFDGGVDAKSLSIGLSYDASAIALKNLILSCSGLWIESKDKKDINELDFVFSYLFFKDFAVDFIYSVIDDKNSKNNSFKNLRAYINYTF